MPHMIADMVTQGENAHFQMLFFQMLFIRPCNPIDEGYVILLITIQSPVLVTCLTFPGAVMKEVTWGRKGFFWLTDSGCCHPSWWRNPSGRRSKQLLTVLCSHWERNERCYSLTFSISYSLRSRPREWHCLEQAGPLTSINLL